MLILTSAQVDAQSTAAAGSAAASGNAGPTGNATSTTSPTHRYGWPLQGQGRGAYVGWSGARWSRDFGVSSGRCNRSDIAALAVVVVQRGAAANAAMGSGRGVGTLRGTSVQTLVGVPLAYDFDDRDRDCVGHALEIGKPGKAVTWINPLTRATYIVVPGRENRTRAVPGGLKCRDYVLSVALPGRARNSRPGVACQSEPGLWIIG